MTGVQTCALPILLSGLLRRIDRTKKALNVEDAGSLEKTIQELDK